MTTFEEYAEAIAQAQRDEEDARGHEQDESGSDEPFDDPYESTYSACPDCGVKPCMCPDSPSEETAGEESSESETLREPEAPVKVARPAREEPLVFISHSCDEHGLIDDLVRELGKSGIRTAVDPFAPGDRTAVRTEEAIKRASHFLLVATPRAINRLHYTSSSYQEPGAAWKTSRWVAVEVALAVHLAERQGIELLPLLQKEIEPPSDLSRHIHLAFERNPVECIDSVKSAIRDHFPQYKFNIAADECSRKIEAGRSHETAHATTLREQYLHSAITCYEEARDAFFLDVNHWLNLGWTLWKLRRAEQAWRHINMAQLIEPEKRRLGTIVRNMLAGRYTF